MQHTERKKLFLWGLPPVPYIFGKLFSGATFASQRVRVYLEPLKSRLHRGP